MRSDTSSHSHSDAKESPIEAFEIHGSSQQRAKFNQQSPAKEQRITTYTLDIEILPPHL